ncbi:cytoplasmic heat shock protein 70 [Histomonas meleagridis]|uniref:cytoplasmic heat shock protein 70 n=1 Tax=Histomonas meleagridis TaxID=135588 RepID=UPI0035599775|nr:cytoplasmic heat shock protein 70 [Histomonas meleagridis]KAH0800784.1 cytoplasmic heat shock protein 70 [Histomonas meleagridis]
MAAIGIDLGTTYSCVGIYRNGEVEIIQNDEGHSTTPSVVSFTSDQRLVGSEAKYAEPFYPESTIFDVKRLIGRKFDDKEVQFDKKNWPFKVVPDANNRPMIKVETNGEVNLFSPEEISAMILEKIKKIAENYLKTEVTDAVITVPANFNDSQRASTQAAGRIAGLNVLRVINEPTAAAIAYGQKQHFEGERNILVYDLGGGTFDVSIVHVNGNDYKVLATAGDTHLGGRDFDNNMFNFFADIFVDKYGCDFRESKRSCGLLMAACENAKIILSMYKSAPVRVQSLYNNINFEETISRAAFECLNEDLFEKTLETVSLVIDLAKIDKSKIDDIVLVGGSSKIPRIKTLLTEYFDGKEPCRLVNPDEAVAYGAAINAEEGSGVVLIDVTPLSLGIELIGNYTDVLIPRNTPIPYEAFRIYTTSEDNQTGIHFKILEGERTQASENNVLGEFSILNLKKDLRGKTKVETTFSIDQNGILTVKVKEKNRDNQKDMVILNEKGRLSEEKVQQMIKKAEQLRANDEEFAKKVLAMNSFENFVYAARKKIMKKYPNNESAEIKNIRNVIQKTIKWTDKNQGAEINVIEAKKKEFEAIVRPFIQ